MEKFKLILGPCAIESREHSLKMVDSLLNIVSQFDVDFYYKSSFDKANRTKGSSLRGVGLEEGSDILQEIREKGVKTLTDVHETYQCSRLINSVDVLQIPAFLCRQTDLISEAAKYKPVNIKKGQFLSPYDMKNVIDKVKSEVWITERGTTFGYNDLVVDFRGLPIMREWGKPVIFDATHSVQSPGVGGQKQFVEPLAKAAYAIGVDGLFMEVHDDPENAISDSSTQIHINDLKNILKSIGL